MEIFFLTPWQGHSKLQGLTVNSGCTKAHHGHIVDFNGAQKTLILFLMKKLERLLAPYLVEIGRIEFILLEKGVYWDFPFTYGESAIAFTPKLLEGSHQHILNVLAHEWVHLDQRRSPEKYEQYYRTLGFRKAQINFGVFEPYLLRNPDADRYEWIWKDSGKVYAPVATVTNCRFNSLLLEIKQADLTVDPREVIVHMTTDVPAYAKRFGTKRQLYHPNEITAHIIADFLVKRVKHVPIDYDAVTGLLMNKT